jgi:hypothetical protein
MDIFLSAFADWNVTLGQKMEELSQIEKIINQDN